MNHYIQGGQQLWRSRQGASQPGAREREKEEAARKKEQNNIQKTALAKGEKMKSADALRHNLRAAELARMTVKRESKDLNDLQEQLARHLGKKPKKTPDWPDQFILMSLMSSSAEHIV